MIEFPLIENKEQETVIVDAFYKLGIDNQLIIAIEELSELQKEICKYKRGKLNAENMAEELAHSIFMIQQLLVFFNNKDLVQKYYIEANERLTNLLKEDKTSVENIIYNDDFIKRLLSRD